MGRATKCGFEYKSKSTSMFGTVACFQLLFFFFPSSLAIVDQEQCIRALFTNPQTSLFSYFFIKNGSHDIIYTIKNYFTIVFSVFSLTK